MRNNLRNTAILVIFYATLALMLSCGKEDLKQDFKSGSYPLFAGEYSGQIKYTWHSGCIDSASVKRSIYEIGSNKLLVIWYTQPATTGQSTIYMNTYTYTTVVFCSPGSSSCGLDAMAYNGKGTVRGDSLFESGTGVYCKDTFSTTFVWEVKAKKQL
jgi:hypothetical protein